MGLDWFVLVLAGLAAIVLYVAYVNVWPRLNQTRSSIPRQKEHPLFFDWEAGTLLTIHTRALYDGKLQLTFLEGGSREFYANAIMELNPIEASLGKRSILTQKGFNKESLTELQKTVLLLVRERDYYKTELRREQANRQALVEREVEVKLTVFQHQQPQQGFLPFGGQKRV